MSQEIIEVLNWFADKLGMSVDWTSENILPLAQEMCGKYANYVIVRNTIGIVFSVLGLIFLVVFTKRIRDFVENDPYSIIDEFFVPIIIIIVFALIIAIIILSIGIAKAATIPELVFVEQLSHLIKSGG